MGEGEGREGAVLCEDVVERRRSFETGSFWDFIKMKQWGCQTVLER